MPTIKPEKKEPKKPLSVTHPELAKEADGWDPSTVTAGSGKKKTMEMFGWPSIRSHNWKSD